MTLLKLLRLTAFRLFCLALILFVGVGTLAFWWEFVSFFLIQHWEWAAGLVGTCLILFLISLAMDRYERQKAHR
jgi:hypothetical protein